MFCRVNYGDGQVEYMNLRKSLGKQKKKIILVQKFHFVPVMSRMELLKSSLFKLDHLLIQLLILFGYLYFRQLTGILETMERCDTHSEDTGELDSTLYMKSKYY